MFLDHVLCRDATLFVGNSKSKTSKQIVSLREAVDKVCSVKECDAAASAHARAMGGFVKRGSNPLSLLLIL